MMLAKSLQSAAGNAAGEANYIEDVFSTWLYTGNGSTQTITNGIDLAGEGGLVWIKERNDSNSHTLFDTLRGGSYNLSTNSINPSQVKSGVSVSFSSSGFTLTGADGQINQGAGNIYASWTFRKQPKFFDVVTFTFASGSPFTFNHSLDSTPACIIFKRTDNASNWITYHRGLNGSVSPNEWNINLNSTAAQYNEGFEWLTSITSTSVTISTDYFADGATYVAYLFAHNAGGFGLSGEDNVISCGSFTTDGSGNATVSLGYEPQFVLFKSSSATGNWNMFDVMRGMAQTQSNWLIPNTSDAENVMSSKWMTPDATGFSSSGGNLAISTTYIYIAIRRGPMKVPESGTSVFAPFTYTGTGSNITTTPNFSPDLIATARRSEGGTTFIDRLRGWSVRLFPYNTNASADRGASDPFFVQTGPLNIVARPYNETGSSGISYVQYAFRRAPGFFDEVCYTGTGSATTFSHNLGVAPELIIVKGRNTNGSTADSNWAVWSNALTTGYNLFINSTSAEYNGNGSWFGSTPSTLTTFGASESNASAKTYVAYLFASAPGVSKVGSYTGTATTLQINCGFTTGARFVLIKRTDSTGDWYVWDSARGIVAGNDPYLLLNSTAAEVTSTDYIDTYSAGFEISSTAPAAINASGGTFIFLAIA